MIDGFPCLGPWDDATFNGVCAACVILLDPEERILLQLRDNRPELVGAGHWALFGGRMEAGESPDQTALREITEETGITLPPTSISRFVRTQSPIGTRLFAFTCTQTIHPHDIRLGEGAGFAFFTKNQLTSQPIVPAIATILHHFFEIHPQIR